MAGIEDFGTAAASRKPLPATVVDQLVALLGVRFSRNAGICEQHGRDEGHVSAQAPDGVAFVESTEEAAAVMRVCAAHSLPVIAFGAGTSLEGQVAAVHGGISIDFTRMNRILRVSTSDMNATVQAGVTRKQLNADLRETGLFFPIDPGPDATLGGMAATRASGTNAVRYGTMREAVLGLTVVLADGSVVHTGGLARKSSAGFDLTRLFVGSEGTLGLITEISLRLTPQPEASSVATCQFPSVEAAVNVVIDVLQSGLPIARIELLDEPMMRAINRYSRLSYAEQPTLFFEFHGSEQSVQEQAEVTRGFVKEAGGSGFAWANTNEERSTLWKARHDALYAAVAMRPGGRAWPTDVCVPISALAQCIVQTQQDLATCSLPCPIVGHVGDGNFHVIFVVDPARPADLAEVEELNGRLMQRALACGGTCTGEHGIGLGKKNYLVLEHPSGVPVMRAIKHALDPAGLLNPGKMF